MLYIYKFCQNKTTSYIFFIYAAVVIVTWLRAATKQEKDVGWSLGDGTCVFDLAGHGRSSYYTASCVLVPGVYTLTCIDTEGTGWKGGSLLIEGNEYCREFTQGNTYTTTVTVTGTYGM